MPFPESVKSQVKKKAHFRCCRCQSLGVEVHHISAETQGGPNNMENAAPLCPSCHAVFGDNPQLRKQIREMRDWWYEQCKKKEESSLVKMEEINELLLEQEGRLGTKISSIEESLQAGIERLRRELRDFGSIPSVSGDDLAASKVRELETQVTALSGMAALGTAVFSGAVNMNCPKCGSTEWEMKASFPMTTGPSRVTCAKCGYPR